MHVTFMFTRGGVNNLIKEEGKCVYADVSRGHPPSVDGNPSPLLKDNRYAGKEMYTTGQTEALYMYTQRM